MNHDNDGERRGVVGREEAGRWGDSDEYQTAFQWQWQWQARRVVRLG